MKLCPWHTDRWESAPPGTSNTGPVITIDPMGYTTPVQLPIMLHLRPKRANLVKRMNSYFEGIKNMWMEKLSLFSPLPFSFLILAIGSITFWTYDLKKFRKNLDNLWKKKKISELTFLFCFLCAKNISFKMLVSLSENSATDMCTFIPEEQITECSI